jgi:hypothetical protein
VKGLQVSTWAMSAELSFSRGVVPVPSSVAYSAVTVAPVVILNNWFWSGRSAGVVVDWVQRTLVLMKTLMVWCCKQTKAAAPSDQKAASDWALGGFILCAGLSCSEARCIRVSVV